MTATSEAIRRLRCVVVLVLAGLVVAACAGDREDEPERSERLTVPPDLSDERIGDVPESAVGQGSATLSDEERRERERASRDVAPEPPGMRVRHQGAERWLEIEAGPGEVWNDLENWLAAEEIPVARKDQQRGVIETEWLPRPLGPAGGALLPTERAPELGPLAEQYLLRVEPTEDEGRTHVFAAHRRVAASGDDGWAPQPSERGLEAEVLRAFMLHLGAEEASAAREAATQQESIVRLETGPDDQPRLLSQEGYLSTWQRVGLALDRAAFTVEDRDRAQGRFLVRYDPAVDEDDGPGFFASLLFWRDREQELEPGTYAILVRSPEEGTAVTVQTEDGEPASERLAERLLTVIREQMR